MPQREPLLLTRMQESKQANGTTLPETKLCFFSSNYWTKPNGIAISTSNILSTTSAETSAAVKR